MARLSWGCAVFQAVASVGGRAEPGAEAEGLRKPAPLRWFHAHFLKMRGLQPASLQVKALSTLGLYCRCLECFSELSVVSRKVPALRIGELSGTWGNHDYEQTVAFAFSVPEDIYRSQEREILHICEFLCYWWEGEFSPASFPDCPAER